MNYLINILKTKAALIILAALAVIVGFLYFWMKSPIQKVDEGPILDKLPPPKIKERYLEVDVQVSSLKGQFTAFPNELLVYQISSVKVSHESALKIANNFGFKEPPQISEDAELGPIYSWASLENYLSVGIRQGFISYGLDLLNNPQLLEGNLSPLEEIKTNAYSFLESQIIPLPQDLKPTINQSQYLKKSGPIFQLTSFPEEAKVVQIDFDFKVNGFRLFTSTPQVFPLTLGIGPEMKIVSLKYQPPFDQFKEFQIYPLKTEEEVLEDIQAAPRISYLQFPSLENLPTEEDYQKIYLLRFKKVELGYYQPLLPEDYLQPVFLISGTALFSDGKTGEVFLYLPAVKN